MDVTFIAKDTTFPVITQEELNKNYAGDGMYIWLAVRIYMITYKK
jgi:hypothetical protein